MSVNGYVGKIKSGKYREKILLFMYGKKYLTPTEISNYIKSSLSQTSRDLSYLENEKLVVCTTPELKKGRIYKLTEFGESIVSEGVKPLYPTLNKRLGY